MFVSVVAQLPLVLVEGLGGMVVQGGRGARERLSEPEGVKMGREGNIVRRWMVLSIVQWLENQIQQEMYWEMKRLVGQNPAAGGDLSGVRGLR